MTVGKRKIDAKLAKIFTLGRDEFTPWAAQAKCAGKPKEYDPRVIRKAAGVTGATGAAHLRREAPRLCAGCPVSRACAEWAVETRAVGVIAAGRYIPAEDTKPAVKSRSEVYAALRRHADGTNPNIGPTKSRSQVPPGKHGTRTGYVHYNCPCTPCRDANARYSAQRYHLSKGSES